MSDSLTAQDTYAALVGPPPVIGNDVPAPEKTRIALGALPQRQQQQQDQPPPTGRLTLTDMAKMWIAKGYTPASAMGMAQNMFRESGGDPTNATGDAGTSEGLFQHHADRKASLEAFARSQGKLATDPQVQVDFADKELHEDMPGLQQFLAKNTDPMAAENRFRTEFERPATNTGLLDSGTQAKLAAGSQQANQILSQMLEGDRAARGQLDRAVKDYKPFTPTPAPPQPDMDPLKHFGGIASIFAVLAAGLSKTPAVAAMNGLAGAIEGAQQHDWQKYQTSYKNWKDGTDYALKMHEQQNADVRAALEMMQTNASEGTAMLNASMAIHDDEVMRPLLVQGKIEELHKLVQDRELTAQKLKEGQPLADASLKLTAAAAARDQAMRSGDQSAIDAANDNYNKAMQEYRDVKQAGYAGRSTNLTAQQELQLMGDWDKQNPGASAEERAAAFNNIRARDTSADKAARADKAGTPAAVATRKYMEEHPDASAKEIQKFITDFKEDAPDVAARKDRQVAVQEKRAATAERTADIHEEYNKQKLQLDQDKFISAKERALRQDEEKERRDRALEDIYRARLVKAPTAAASKERDAEILAESNFTAKEGRGPTGSQEDLTKMAQLRTEARRNSSNEVISDEAADFTAERVLAGDERATVGMARSSANITKVTNHLVMKAKELNVSPRELAARIAEFMGTVAGERTLGIRTANMEIAAQEVAQFAPLVMQRSNAIDRSEYPDLNSLILAYERKTGSPDVVLFGQAVNSMVYAYAKFLNPTGVLTDADKTKAQEILNIAWTGGQFEATVKQIQMEIEFGQKAVGGVRQEFRQGFGGAVGTQPPPTQGPARISTDAEYNALPSGADFIGPDGKQRKKP